MAEPSDDPFLGAARRALRGIILGRDDRIDGLPGWAVDIVPDGHLAAINKWVGAQDWPTQSAWLHSHVSSGLLDASVRDTAALYPEHQAVDRLAKLLSDFDSGRRSLTEELASGDRQWQVAQQVKAWLATTSWDDSRQMLALVPELRSVEARSVLDQFPSDQRCRQHLALIDLMQADGVNEHDLFEWAGNPHAAQARALVAIERGELELLERLVDVSPSLVAQRPHGLLVALVVAHVRGELRDDVDLQAPLREWYDQFGENPRLAARVKLNALLAALSPGDEPELGSFAAAAIGTLA